MSVWFAFWVVISAALLGFLGWSLYVLHTQKTAWRTYAEKHKLRFKPNALMEGPQMDGVLQGYKISFFTSEHSTSDARGMRKLTAIELSLHSVMPIEGGVASGGLVPIVRNLGLKFEVQPEHALWNPSYIAAGSHRQALNAYLNEKRLEALAKLMSVRNSWGILIFRNDRMLLRLDTPNPLDNEERLERVTNLMIKAAKILELGPDEAKKLKAEEARSPVADAALALDGAALDHAANLRLEDDERADEPADQSSNESEDS